MSDPIRLSPERVGRITASRFKDALDVPEDAGQPFKSGPRKGQPRPSSSAARNTYMRQLAYQRRSGNELHEVSSRSLAHGIELEPYGKGAFEVETGYIIQPGGFATHPAYPFIGASADGVVLDHTGKKLGGYESKSPYSEDIHVQTLLDGMPEDHMFQVQGGMMVYDLPAWFFVSFDPRQHPDDQLFIQVIKRDDEFIRGTLLPGLLQFEAELQGLIRKIASRPPLKLDAA